MPPTLFEFARPRKRNHVSNRWTGEVDFVAVTILKCFVLFLNP